MIGLLPYIDHILQFANQSSSERRLRDIEGSRFVFWMLLILGSTSYVMVLAGLVLHLLQTQNVAVALCAVGLILLSTLLFIGAGHRFNLYLRQRKVEKAFTQVTDEISGIVHDFSKKCGEGYKDHAVLFAALSAGVGYFVTRRLLS